ncbi:MAG: histidine kinase [Spirochaetia bacterium]|jgi:two-component system sensor histidine kinase YesM
MTVRGVLASTRRAIASLPIRRKINLSYVIITFFGIAVMILTSVQFSTMVIFRNKTEDARHNLDLLLDGFDILFDSIENYSKMAVTNPEIQEILRRIGNTGGQVSFADATAIRLLLNNIIYPKSSADAMILKDGFGNLFSTSQIVVTDPPRYQLLRYDQTLQNPFWVDTHTAGYRTGDRTDVVISLVRMFYDYYSGAPLGLLETTVKERVIAARYSGAGAAVPWDIIITNQSGIIVSAADPSQLRRDIRDALGARAASVIMDAPGSRILPVNGQSTLVVASSYPRLGWRVFGLIQTRAFMGDLTVLVLRILLLGAGCVLVAIALSTLVSGTITRPLARLTAAVKSYSRGSSWPSVTNLSGDEIGVLGGEFHRMVERNALLMRQVLEEQEKIRRHELALLQSQINPHFLYNTFEVICSLAELERTRDIIDMVTTLAAFYRTTLSGGRSLVTLETEIALTRQYLTILSIRYQDRFCYRFDVDPAVVSIEIPKLTIQPLVENSIQHGIRQRAGPGNVCIRAGREGQALLITVEDNGVGVTEDILDQIRAGTYVSMRGTGLGLRSILDRLILAKGKDCRMTIDSTPGTGTRVVLTIPLPVSGTGPTGGGEV